MNKKYIMIGITCILLLVSGICYSCAYQKGNDSSVLMTSLADGESAEEQNNNQSNNIQNNNKSNDNQSAFIQSTQEKDTSNSGDINRDGQNSQEVDQQQKEQDQLIYVHICGAVMNPGVYQAEPGARIYDLIELSGGLCEDAAGDYINQALEVSDGQRIYVPTTEELKEISAGEYLAGNENGFESSNESSGNTSALTNINTAGVKELMDLPGIGQAKADSIIEYRNANGNFKTIEDLMNIPGIKEGLFSQISSYITVN
jgi:competence protein ComEA